MECATRKSKSARELAALLSRHRFVVTREHELQEAIGAVLRDAGVDHVAEVNLPAVGRIDFLAGRVGIEVKIDGSLAALTRQAFGYLQDDRVDELLVVTTLHRLCQLEPVMAGKPVVACHVGAGL